ncbi:uncharacterized protein [Littorina saxatilis]|uniref:uncharacterized protein n=1 Tax=Littorina saxatilis TaxID=31220 RepID=UPI0038B6AC53
MNKLNVFLGMCASCVFMFALLLLNPWFQISGNNFLFPWKQERLMLYVCGKDQGCGGWSDRQKGIVNVFLLACVTNRRFGVILQSPCDVRNFYVPNEYNWVISDAELRSRKTNRTVTKLTLQQELLTIDFNQKYPEEVIYVGTNGEHYKDILANPNFQSTIPSWGNQTYFKLFNDAWKMLMKPTQRVQERVTQFLDSIHFWNRTKPLVGVHVRMGKNPSNPRESVVINTVDNLGAIWAFLQEFVQNGSHVFMATDSAEVRNLSRTKFGPAHHDTGGSILHVAKQRREQKACQGFEDAILDQLLLTYCDVLITSRSGFSTRASYMRGSYENVFLFNKGKIWPLYGTPYKRKDNKLARKLPRKPKTKGNTTNKETDRQINRKRNKQRSIRGDQETKRQRGKNTDKETI